MSAVKKWTIGIGSTLLVLVAAIFSARQPRPDLPYWRYQSLTAPNATAADLEQSLRVGLVGTDHAEFTYLGPNQIGITSFGSSPRNAMHLSAQLEEFAQNSLQSRGIGPVITEPDDTGAYSDGDPDEFPLWRVHHLVRTLGFRGWHFEEFD